MSNKKRAAKEESPPTIKKKDLSKNGQHGDRINCRDETCKKENLKSNMKSDATDLIF